MNVIREKHSKRQLLRDIVPVSTPFSIYIDPCGRCIFKCEFCPCNNSDYNVGQRHQIMDFALFEKITEDLLQFDKQIMVVNLYAFGEPLLNPHLIDMIKLLKDKKVCREIRITTNGALLSPALNKSLIESGLDMLRISIEALSSRGYQELCGVSLDFEHLRNNIKDFYIRSRGRSKVSIKMLSTLLSTEKEFEQFKILFSDRADYWYIENMEERWQEYLSPQRFGQHVEGETKLISEKNEVYICHFPFTEMTIASNGAVLACAADWRYQTAYGNVYDASLREIWEGPSIRNFRLLHLNKERAFVPGCQKCKIAPIDYISPQDRDIITQRLRVCP